MISCAVSVLVGILISFLTKQLIHSYFSDLVEYMVRTSCNVSVPVRMFISCGSRVAKKLDSLSVVFCQFQLS